jgi:MFS family permease
MTTTTEKFTPDRVVVASKAGSSETANDCTPEDAAAAALQKTSRISSVLTVLVAGLALFSDGYNAQIIGYMKPVFKELYKDGMSSAMSTRLSNSYLIGEVFGMLFFGWAIDKIGRRQGVVFATLFLVLGIVLSSECELILFIEGCR